MLLLLKQYLLTIIHWLLPPATKPLAWPAAWSQILAEYVVFYQVLSLRDKRKFEQRCADFLQRTRIESRDDALSDTDQVLIAASAIIPAWGLPGWQYFNLNTVIVLPSNFNEDFVCGGPDARISGMVGTGLLNGKMVLSRTDLHFGYSNNQDKYNVGIHEFVHLMDMADGYIDGLPKLLHAEQCSEQWFDFVATKIQAIDRGETNIRRYGATNEAEFFAVASEYFFERPRMMKRRYPELFDALCGFFKQNPMAIEQKSRPRRKAPCPCGSGKRYKHCCGH